MPRPPPSCSDLLPARFLVAGGDFGRMRLLPGGNRQGLVGRHLVVHARQALKIY